MDTSDAGNEKPTVYIETSIVSYLTARPSRDLLVAAHQQLTVVWWDKQRIRYRDLYLPSGPGLRHARATQTLPNGASPCSNASPSWT